MTTGNIQFAARHEIVNGLPDDDFQNLFNAFQSPI